MATTKTTPKRGLRGADAPFDEAAFRQQLIERGTDPATAREIAAKTAASRAAVSRSTPRPPSEERPTGDPLPESWQPVPPSEETPSSMSPNGATVQPKTLRRTPVRGSTPAHPGVAPAVAAKRAGSRKPKGPAPVPDQAFSNRQLALFQSFLANDDAQRDILSNAVDLWDSIPRYSLSRRKQDELRQPGGYLPIRKIAFQYRGIPLTAVIRPARIEVRQASGAPSGETIEYYPSSREELIEQALRRLATEKASGFFDGTQPRSGLHFTLYRLRQELADRGHAMTHRDLAEGLDVLSLSHIDIETEDQDELGLHKFGRTSFLVNLAGVSREDLERDPHARWYVEFHPFVTASIEKIAYRQFNYDRWMKARTQLARWLINQLVLKFTQAAVGTSFVMKYSTIKRDSGLLGGYKLERQAVAALDEALDELKELHVLASYRKEERRGARAKLEDVSYTLFPTSVFAREQRAANRRSLDAKAAVAPPPTQDNLL